MEFLQITMIRPDMSNIPQHEFPQGYGLRRFRWEDISERDTWVRVQQLAEPVYTMDQATFDKNFGQDLLSMPERSFFLIQKAEIRSTEYRKARNPKQIQNTKQQIQNDNKPVAALDFVLNFAICRFGFVSDFGFSRFGFRQR